VPGPQPGHLLLLLLLLQSCSAAICVIVATPDVCADLCPVSTSVAVV